MSGIGIVAALTAEARTLGPTQPLAGAADPILALADGRLLMISGMGAAAAARAAQMLVAHGAHSLMSFGLAGALEPQLAAGAVLLPDAIADGTGAVLPTYAPWRERLAAQLREGRNAREAMSGLLLSVAQPLTSAQSKREARAASGACAVDMESFAIATVAVRSGLPFVALRVVADVATDDLPRGVIAATGARGEVHVPRLLAAVVRAPAQIPALLQLARRYRSALRALRMLAQLDLEAS